MKRQIITIISIFLFTLLSISQKTFAQVEACISLPSTHTVITDTKNGKKSVWICKNTYINLIGNNCLGNTTPADEKYTWVNLSKPFLTSEAQNFFTPDSGRWELTVENLNDYSIDKDTIQVKYFFTTNLVISQSAPNVSLAPIVAGACFNDVIKLNANASTVLNGYQWFLENDPTPLSSTNSFTLNTKDIPGGSAYYIATTNYNGTNNGVGYTCLLSDTILAFQKQSIAFKLPKDTVVCSGQSITLDPKVTLLPDDLPANITGLTYRWSSTINNITTDSIGSGKDGANIFAINNINAATKIILIVKNSLGCTATDSIKIGIKPSLTVDVGPALSVCKGSSIQLDAKVTGGIEQVNYDWIPSSGLDNSKLKSPTTIISTAMTYTVSVTDAKGCTGSATKTINITPALTIKINNDTTICSGASVKLDATVDGASPLTPYIFTWTPSTSLDNASISSPITNTASTTTYSVNVSDPNGCKGNATTTITVKDGIIITPAFTDSTTADLDVIQLKTSISGGDGSYVYSWTPISPIDPTPNANINVNPSEATTYKLNVKDGISCSAEVNIFIDKLWVDLGSEDTSGILGDSIKLDAFNKSQLGFSYKWKDSTGNVIGTDKIFYAKNPGMYKVYVFNPITLSFVADSQRVKLIREIKPIIEVPNVLSPSMANENDRNLRVYGQSIIDDNFLFQIYDNWGQLVYESRSFKEANESGWNGSYKNSGKELNLGVYTYTVKGEFKDGSSFSKSGTASLLK